MLLNLVFELSVLNKNAISAPLPDEKEDSKLHAEDSQVKKENPENS